MTLRTPRDVLDFWIAAGPKKWFSHDSAFDGEIRQRGGDLHRQAVDGACDRWEESIDGALALILVLDQFSRNIFRGSPRAWDSDARALAVAEHAIARRFDAETPAAMRRWFYMPFMHAESVEAQRRCVALFAAFPDGADSLKWARHHCEIIEKFGRFPHRNALLKRQTTAEETAWLDQDDFRG